MITIQVWIEDADERTHVVRGLPGFSHRAVAAASWEEAAEAAMSGQAGMLIVDHGAIGGIADLRAAGVAIPILAITRMRDAEQRIAALDAGADACLATPFRLAELSARVNSLVRMAIRSKSEKLRVDALMLDLGTGEVMHGEKPVRISRMEFALLDELVRNAGRMVSRPTLLSRLWQSSQAPGTDIVSCQVARLCDTLRRAGRSDAIGIEGEGYVLRSCV